MANIGYRPIEQEMAIRLAICDDRKMYEETLDKIVEFLRDGQKIGKVVGDEIQITNKTRVEKWRSKIPIATDSDLTIKKCIEQFVQKHQQWNFQLSGSVGRLLEFDLFRKNRENIQFFQGFVPICETPKEDPTDLKTLRRDLASADVFFLFGAKRITAHKSVLQQIPYFAERFATVKGDQPYGLILADEKTIEVFLDVLYGILNVRICPLEEYLQKFLDLHKVLNDENVLKKFLTYFVVRLNHENCLDRTSVFRSLLDFPWRCIPYRLWKKMSWRPIEHLKILEKYPNNPLALTLLGICQLELQIKDDFAAHSKHFYERKGREFFEKKRLQLFRKAVEIDRWPPVLYELGCYDENNKIQNMLEAAEGGYVDAWEWLGDYYRHELTGSHPPPVDWDQVIEYFACALSLSHPEDEERILKSIEECQKFQAAKELFRMITEKPQKPEPKKESLRDVLTQLLNSEFNGEDMYLAAKGHEHKGNWAKALALYQRAADRGHEKAKQRLEKLTDVNRALQKSFEDAGSCD